MKYIVGSCPALKEFDYLDPVRADQLSEPGRITSQVIKHLIDDDLVIADLSGNNANVYYELSLRHALGKPAVHLALLGTSISFDLRDNRTIFYTMHARVAEGARDELTAQIRHVHKPGYKATNPIVETAGIIKLEQSADPQQNAIGELMRSVDLLRNDVAAMGAGLRDIKRQTGISKALEHIYPGLLTPSSGSGADLSSAGMLGGLNLQGTALQKLFVERMLDPETMGRNETTKVRGPTKKKSDKE